MQFRTLVAGIAAALMAVGPTWGATGVAILDGDGNPQTLSATQGEDGAWHYNDVEQFILGGQPVSVSLTSPLPVAPADQVPSSQTITTEDLVSTSSDVQGGQVWWTGTPSSGSAATFALDGVEQISVTVSGTWTGTLEFETSRDGVHWTPRALHPDGASASVTTVTADVQGDVKAAGVQAFRVRATAAMTGTATVTVVESTNAVRFDADLVGTNGLALDSSIGDPGASACATDTGSCSLNALLQRIAEHLTTADTDLGGTLSATVGQTTPADLEAETYAQLSNGSTYDAALDTKALDSGVSAGVVADGQTMEDNDAGAFATLPALSELRDQETSASGAAINKVYDLRGLKTGLDIYAVCSAGTATLAVEGSSDDSHWLTLDSLTAAATQTKFYTGSTAGASIALSPLLFRWVQIVVGECGTGDTSTLTVAAK